MPWVHTLHCSLVTEIIADVLANVSSLHGPILHLAICIQSPLDRSEGARRARQERAQSDLRRLNSGVSKRDCECPFQVCASDENDFVVDRDWHTRV